MSDLPTREDPLPTFVGTARTVPVKNSSGAGKAVCSFDVLAYCYRCALCGRETSLRHGPCVHVLLDGQDIVLGDPEADTPIIKERNPA